MGRNRQFLAAFLVFAGTVGATMAQTSAWTGMAVAGDPTRWGTTPNMMLVADYTWQGEFYITAPSNAFKFVANNNWTYSWRQTNHPAHYTVPFTGRVDQLANIPGGDIVFTNATPGFYRFTFNESNGTYRVDLLYTLASGVNIISNPSFEAQGSDPEKAQYWQMNNPDTHGDYWNPGNDFVSRRQSWRAHSGTWEATIYGKWWSGRDDFGGWWREGAATPGLSYQGSAWFWADNQPLNKWTAALMELKIEFYDAGYTQLLVVATNFQNIVEAWTKESVTGTAPAGTAWARLVIASSGNGTQGALQIDDAELRAVYTRTQDFNQWALYTNDGCNTWDDWTICTGKTTTANARSGYAASLPPNPAGYTNYIRSPQLMDGLGTISFWYRNADTDVEATSSVSFIVQESPNGTTWTTIGSMTNITTLSYQQYSVFTYQPSPYYLRIIRGGETNGRLLVDDIAIEMPNPSPRYMDFNTWSDSGTNMGTNTYLEWVADTGRVSTIDAKEGKSLYLPPNGGGSNILRTPFFPGGFGTISFWYARGTNGSGPTQFSIEKSPNGTNWYVIAIESNIVNTGYAQYSHYFYETAGAYVRICNYTNPPTLSEGVLLDEEFNGGTNPPPGWIFSGISGAYSSAGNFGNNAPSIRFDTTGDWITTPGLNGATNFSFWLKGISTGSNPNQFLVEAASGGTWTTVTNITPLPTTGTNFSFAVVGSVTNIRFTYSSKVLGNVALDDVIISGVGGVAQPPQALLIDQVNVDWPILWRNQDFDDWPTTGAAYDDHDFQGWHAHAVVINDTKAYSGQSARLDETIGNHAYIQSPYIPDGLGTISFVYARYIDYTPAATNQVLISQDGTNWSEIGRTVASSSTYTAFSKYIYATNYHYLRIYHLSGGSHEQLIDNIVIGTPKPPADMIVNGSHDPATPYTNDRVSIRGAAYPQYDASILSMTSYYRIGTSGAFTALSMTITDRVNYASVTSIAPQAVGTRVQYYIRCDFTGPASESNSPRFYPSGGSNNPAWYSIPRSATGRAWINEVNYLNGYDTNTWAYLLDTNEFIEICGPAGMDLGGWKVELYYYAYTNSGYSYYASYTIPNGAVLPNDNAGFGFYVLGDAGLPQADYTLTITNEIDFTQISDGYFPSGIRLLNEGGGIEQSISYQGEIPQFTTVRAYENFIWPNDPFALQLAGVGTNYVSFAWRTNSMTPGAVNVGQTLGPNSSDPDLDISGLSRGLQLTITMPSTNGWWPEVSYTTALLPNPQSWILIGTRTVTTNAGVWTIQFAQPAGQNNCLFRVEMLK